MIKLRMDDGRYLDFNPIEKRKDFYYPDGTFHLTTENYCLPYVIGVAWSYENSEEETLFRYLVSHIQNNYPKHDLYLELPYVPHARMDRVYSEHDFFMLKMFANFINSFHFRRVYISDPHSSVVNALIENVKSNDMKYVIENVIRNYSPDFIFYPDGNAAKKYSRFIDFPHYFSGEKHRDWETGKIDWKKYRIVENDIDIKGKDILIVDDICSRGGTFLCASEELKRRGANKIYLYITHCENSIFEGKVLQEESPIDKVITTNSILTKPHKNIQIIEEFFK